MKHSNKSQILLELDSYADRDIRALWSELTKDRNYRCPICGKQNIEANFIIDHSHISGEIRNVICRSCNYLLHYIEDLKATSDDFRPFYDYLERAKEEEIELTTFYNDLKEVM